MKKRTLLILLFALCVVYIPKDTFALQVSNNVIIDYRFFVDEDDDNAGNLKFKLYDKTGTLNFESEYDSNSKQYYFKKTDLNVIIEDYGYFGVLWSSIDSNKIEDTFREYIPYYNELSKLSYSVYYNAYEGYYESKDQDEVISFLNSHNIHGEMNNYRSNWNFYTYIPLVLEEEFSGFKKIVFASVSVRNEHDYFSKKIWNSFTQLFLVNNIIEVKTEPVMLGESFLENVDFMRKNVLDYSDELWENLSNEPIASSEIYSDIKASSNYKYINQSINGGTRNVPEETLEDYANSLPVLSFKKVDSIDNNKDSNTNNIVNIITNPKTWNNGVLVLIISMIVIGGSSIVLIKRKS